MMYNPCFECMNRHGHSYTEECDNRCGYAKEIKEYKEMKNNAVIFPQTIGDITFYSKDELFEWVENMQKEFCSMPNAFFCGEVEKPIKIVFEGEAERIKAMISAEGILSANDVQCSDGIYKLCADDCIYE